jgi:CRP/FNR family cyclic AMP-dependent transcriptional regulator
MFGLQKEGVNQMSEPEAELETLIAAFIRTPGANLEEFVEKVAVIIEKEVANKSPPVLAVRTGRSSRAHAISAAIARRSRVNVFMNKFRKLGFIEYNGDLKVHNSLLDMVLHAKPELDADGPE